MKIALIGATGRVGSAILTEALERGHEVTAIARHPEKLAPHPHLKTVAADVADPAATAAAVKGANVVISAFNAGWANPNIRADIKKGFAGIVAGVRQAGVGRIVVLGGAGSLMEDGKRIVDDPAFNPKFKDGALGAADMLDMVRHEPGLKWTFVSPAKVIEPGAKTGTYRHGGDEPVKDAAGKSTISMGDLAHAIVTEAETGRHVGRRFTVGY